MGSTDFRRYLTRQLGQQLDRIAEATYFGSAEARTLVQAQSCAMPNVFNVRKMARSLIGTRMITIRGVRSAYSDEMGHRFRCE